MPDVRDVLNAAADLLEKPGAWTTGHVARDAVGYGVTTHHPAATCWCVVGALEKASGAETFPYDAFGALRDSLGLPNDTDPALLGELWNDAPGRTQAEVVAALRSAAQSAGAEG